VRVSLASEFFVTGQIALSARASQPFVLDSYALTAGLQAGKIINHDEFGPDQPSLHAQANSLADRGGARAHAFVSIIKPSDTNIFPGGAYAAGAFARATFPDFIIDGPTSTVVTPMHFHVTGEQTVGSSAGTNGRSNNATSSVQLSLSVFEGNTSFGSLGGFNTIQVVNGTPAPLFGAGIMLGFDGDEIFTIPDMVLPVGTPFTVEIELQASSVLDYNSTEPAFTAVSNTAFDSTAAFVNDRPIFGLPAGYSANSISAGVVNNRLAPVPLPPALWLLASGMLVAASAAKKGRIHS